MVPDRPPTRLSGLRLLLAAVLLATGAAAADVVVPIDRLMAIGPLADIAQGSPSAPITVVEYASMTCTHCAAFQETTWPELKRKYVDAGRVRFILREFPLDPLATAAFMLARCAGPGKRNLVIDRLFERQKDWAFVEKPAGPLFAVATTVGFSETEFQTCLRDRKLYDSVNQSRDLAAKTFAIDATPTFFVNGHALTGEVGIVDFDKAIADAAR